MNIAKLIAPSRRLVLGCASLTLVLSAGCGKKPAAPAQPAPAAAARPAPAAEPAAAVAPAAAATAETAAAAEKAEANPLQNAWGLAPRGTSAKDGDRVYVLTQGKDRSYMSDTAVYHLFAYDIGEVKGDLITVKELGGGQFKVTGLFIVPAGVAKPEDVKAGDMVLAEWASSLKHAVVTKVDADKIAVRYTDLPDSWPEDRITAVKTLREVTKQQDGLQPGNFAIAMEDGRPIQVLLIASSGDKWLARRFAGRVGAFETKDLKAIPIKPALKAGQTVQAPWVGMMYPGKVKKVIGTRVEVVVEGIATKEPVITSLGQVAPE